MAFWPFGRKKKKKTENIKESVMSGPSVNMPENSRRDLSQNTMDINSTGVARKLSRKGSNRTKRSWSRKYSKAPKTLTQEAEKVPSLADAGYRQTSARESNAVAGEKAAFASSAPTQDDRISKVPTNRDDIPSYYFQNPMSQASIQPEKFSAVPRIPTLNAKRSANDSNLPRRKSSKRKADDHAREQEIKAMSASSPIPIPKRPYSNTSGLLARDRKNIPGGPYRPTSDVSVPLAESLRSSVSGASGGHGMTLGTLDALSPRPTIRYSGNLRNNASGISLGPSRSSTRKEKRAVIPEESLRLKKQIDDLADDLDARDLREIMERDQRRRQKKRITDQEKLQRKLERRAEKQRENARPSTEAPGGASSMGNTDAARDIVGLGIGEATAIAEPDKKDKELLPDQVPRSSRSWLGDPSREHLPQRNPFLDPVAPQTSTSHLETPTPGEERDEPILQTAQVMRLSQVSMSPPTSPTRSLGQGPSLAQLSDMARRSTPDIPEIPGSLGSDKRDSDTSAGVRGSWTSIFRRSGTRGTRSPASADRGRIVPSEFVNTSRESISRQQPPSALARNIRRSSGTPVRTRSRFREDLPELPISPPDSRVASPENARSAKSSGADITSSPVPGMTGVASTSDRPLSDIHPAFREEVAISRQTSLHAPSPDPALLSQSLASVDSEGSWLTGRPVKRTSQPQVNPLRESGDSLHKRLREFNSSEDDFVGKDSDFTRRLTPAPEEGRIPAETNEREIDPESATFPEESDEEADGELGRPQPSMSETWHGAIGRSPTIVRQGARVKSREGLLNEFQADEDSGGSSPSASPPEGDDPSYVVEPPENPFVHRATSVDLGKNHARHISAGSAKLLNLPARASGESKRLSSASGERSPLGPPSPGVLQETKK